MPAKNTITSFPRNGNFFPSINIQPEGLKKSIVLSANEIDE